MTITVKVWNWLIIITSLFLITSCGPTIRDSFVMIDNESGTVNVGNKDVSVPIRTTIPVQ